MKWTAFVLFMALVCAAMSLPLESGVNDSDANQRGGQSHNIQKRFVNPMFAFGGGSAISGVKRMRTKREAGDECEKLELCKLHARSHRSFLAAFELYFVNKENARQWDHHERSLADCESRFGDCYEE